MRFDGAPGDTGLSKAEGILGEFKACLDKLKGMIPRKRLLGKAVAYAFISVSFFIHLFLMYNDMFIHLWYGAEEARETLAITLKDYLPAHLFEVLAPLAAVILLLNARVRQSATAVAASCVLLISGVFVHRFLIMPAAFDRIPLTIAPLGLQNVTWQVPIASGRYSETADTFVTAWHYFPSAIEITIVLGVLAYMCFLVMVAIDRLPITERSA